jgi:hypothetical protein
MGEESVRLDGHLTVASNEWSEGVAIEYSIYTDLDNEELLRQLTAAAVAAGPLWVSCGVLKSFGPFHEEVMREYGVDKGFKSQAWSRHNKSSLSEARKAMIEFYSSLPGRKLILNGDVYVDFCPA